MTTTRRLPSQAAKPQAGDLVMVHVGYDEDSLFWTAGLVTRALKKGQFWVKIAAPGTDWDGWEDSEPYRPSMFPSEWRWPDVVRPAEALPPEDDELGSTSDEQEPDVLGAAPSVLLGIRSDVSLAFELSLPAHRVTAYVIVAQ